MLYKRAPYFLFYLMVIVSLSGKLKAQCNLFCFPTLAHNCVTNTTYIELQISGTAPAPYSFTVAYGATVNTGTTATSTGTAPYYSSGIYNVTLTAANGCSLTIPTSVGPGFFQTTVFGSVTSTNVSCFGGSNGAAFAVPPTSFSTVPFSFTWTPGSINTQSITNMSAGIIYTVVTRDGNGCQVSNTVSVSQPAEINTGVSATYVSCFGATLLTVPTSSGGVAPYTYSLNGTPTGTSMVVIAGTHSLQTKDAQGCLKTNTIVITQAPQVNISFNAFSPSCPGMSDGSLNASVLNGPAPYSFSWQPVSSSSSNLNTIPAGLYTLTVIDASTCATRSVVTVAPAIQLTVTASIQPENCSASDGAFTINISGGTSPFTYTTYPLVNSNNPILNISSGSYTTVVKDFKNCLDTLKFVVGNLSIVNLNISSSNSISCYNACNGSVVLNASNAVPPLTYSATGLPSSSSNVFNNLCPGFYTFKVVDANGCPATTNINFPSPAFYTYSVATPPPICYGKQSTLNAVAFGGNGGYSYLWNPGNINGQQALVSPTATMVYSLNVFDSKGCTLSPFQVTVAVNPQISISISTAQSGICPGSTAQITPTVSGGDGNYTYLWLPGNTTEASVFIESVIVPTYTFIVNDKCGSPTAIQEIEVKLFDVKQPSFITAANKGCEPFCTSFINTTPQSQTAIWNFGDRPNEYLGDNTEHCYQKSGSYHVKLTVIDQNSCKASFTQSNSIQVIAAPKVDFITNPETITMSQADQVLIQDASNGANTFAWWIDGVGIGTDKTVYYTFPDTGCYLIKHIAKNEDNCKDSIQKSICVLEDFRFFMPMAFTPNNDHLNDILIPKGTGWSSEDYLFEIYNQWGNLLFTTNDMAAGWNGDYRENKANATKPKADKDDAYVWRIFITDNQGQKHKLDGSVIILK